MRILFIGDIYGKPGRKAVRLLLPRLRERYHPHVILANGENMAGGAGINRDTSREMLKLGIAGMTTGNHVFDQREAIELLQEDIPIVRPINYPPGTPGRGCMLLTVEGEQMAVINVQGRVFMRSLDDPFRAMDQALDSVKNVPYIFVDMHAEATAEKQGMGFYLDGRVSALVGTHTHVPTADERVLANGTAYITDVGMVGPRDSVIGADPEAVVQRFLTQMYHRYEVGQGPVTFNGVVIDLESNGRAINIERVQETITV